ncbi:hypothetical protein ACK3TF_000710 [Chlorella vulgaris]
MCIGAASCKCESIASCRPRQRRSKAGDAPHHRAGKVQVKRPQPHQRRLLGPRGEAAARPPVDGLRQLPPLVPRLCCKRSAGPPLEAVCEVQRQRGAEKEDEVGRDAQAHLDRGLLRWLHSRYGQQGQQQEAPAHQQAGAGGKQEQPQRASCSTRVTRITPRWDHRAAAQPARHMTSSSTLLARERRRHVYGVAGPSLPQPGRHHKRVAASQCSPTATFKPVNSTNSAVTNCWRCRTYSRRRRTMHNATPSASRHRRTMNTVEPAECTAHTATIWNKHARDRNKRHFGTAVPPGGRRARARNYV